MTYEIKLEIQMIVAADTEDNARSHASGIVNTLRAYGFPLVWTGSTKVISVSPVSREELAELGG